MGDFEVVRSITVNAQQARVHALVDDFHAWRGWSPWEGIDPLTERTYSGPDHGPGAFYSWSGNRKAGAGSMQITSSTPDRVELVLSFLKPFKATNEVWFELVPVADVTVVTWRMRGRTTGLMTVLSPVIPMDRLVGRDFEKGLEQLKTLAESLASGR